MKETATKLLARDRYNEDEGSEGDKRYRKGFNDGVEHACREIDLRLRDALIRGGR